MVVSIYIQNKTPEEMISDSSSLANLLGTSNESLMKSVNNRTFTSCANKLGANFNKRKYKNETFVCIGSQNEKDCHTPEDQDSMKLPNWVEQILQVSSNATDDSSDETVSGATTDSRYENDTNKTSKSTRGKDRRVKHTCGECGEFELPSRYIPILSSTKKELDSTVERLKHEVVSLQRNILEINENMEKQHRDFRSSLNELGKQLKQKTDDTKDAKSDDEQQKLIRIEKNIISTLNNDKWMGSPSSYRKHGLNVHKYPPNLYHN